MFWALSGAGFTGRKGLCYGIAEPESAASCTVIAGCKGRGEDGDGFRGRKNGWPFRKADSILEAMSLPVSEPRLEPATIEDLPQLVELLVALFSEESDFEPDKLKQEHGLRLILEQPNRGRIFVLRTEHMVIGMVNLLFTISTAEGGLVILMEDVIVHPQHRRQGYGSLLLNHAIEFARAKHFKRITLLTDKISAESQAFFVSHGFSFSSMIPMRLVFDAEF
jgi:GNAT superfamily N-acetyltransferase